MFNFSLIGTFVNRRQSLQVIHPFLTLFRLIYFKIESIFQYLFVFFYFYTYNFIKVFCGFVIVGSNRRYNRSDRVIFLMNIAILIT